MIKNHNRQAVDSIRGYVYQIYQSLFAWMKLKPDEILILEGAEDFDIYSEGRVNLVQVKNTKKSSTITLNSQCVKKSLHHFLEYKQNLPDNKIQYHFLTTSSIGCEKGSPFGEGICGLNIWENLKSNSTPVEPLVNYLLNANISTEVNDFLSQNSSEKIRNELIEPIHWDADQKPLDALIEVIENFLVAHGNNFNIPAHDSIKTKGNLLEKVIETIINPNNRILCYKDFYIEFENAVKSWKQTTDVFPQPLINQRSSIPFMDQQILFEGVLKRVSIIKQYNTILEKSKLVIFHGSTGTGKTTLAKLLIKQTDLNWRWISFTNREPSEIQNFLISGIRDCLVSETPWHIVIDDIDFKKYHLYENELIGFIFGVIRTKGTIIITSQLEPTVDFNLKIWNDYSVNIKVPYFNKDEISEFISFHGNSNETSVKEWTKIIFVFTQGHPQLVHAIVKYLQSKLWDYSEIGNFKPIKKVKLEAQRRFFNDVLSSDVKNLACRLSILPTDFTKEIAFKLAKMSPEIQLPGEPFDALVGPWIEVISENKYRVSPLLTDLAQNYLDQSEQNNLREMVAIYIIGKGKITSDELSMAFAFALVSKSEKVLYQITAILMRDHFKKFNLLAVSLEWFTNFALKKYKLILSDNLELNADLRILQYRIASRMLNKKNAIKVADLLILDLKRIKNKSKRETKTFLAYSMILFSHEVSFKPGYIFKILPTYLKLYNKFIKNGIIARNFNFSQYRNIYTFIEKETGNPDIFRFIFYTVIYRIIEVEHLEEFFESVNKSNLELKNRIIDVFKNDLDLSDLLIGYCSSRMDISQKSRIMGYIQIFEKILQYSKTWGVDNIGINSYISLSAIYIELYGLKEAISKLDEAASIYGNNNHQIMNQKAKLLFHNNRFLDSLELLRKILSNNPILPKSEMIYSYRMAAICEAKLNEMENSCKFFKKGLKNITRKSDETLKIGFSAEIALINWKRGSRKKSLEIFRDVLEMLDKISDLTEIKVKTLFMKISHTLGWIYSNAHDVPDRTILEPNIGWISNPLIDDKIKEIELKVNKVSFLWSILSNIENITDISVGINYKAKKILRDQTTNMIKISRILDNFKKNYFSNNFEKLVIFFIPLAEAMSFAHTQRIKGATGFEISNIPRLPDNYWHYNHVKEFLIFLLAGCISITMKSPELELPIVNWKRDIHNLKIKHTLIDEVFELLEGQKKIFTEDTEVLYGFKYLLLLRQKQKTPIEYFGAHFNLMGILFYSQWKILVENDLEKIVTSDWRNIIENQRFALRSPDVFIPNIIKVLDNDKICGFKKIASILRSACPTVDITLNGDAKKLLDIIDEI